LGARLGGVVDAGGAGALAGQPRHVVRVIGEVPRHAPLARASEAAHPFRRIGRESDPGLFAVVADVDARLELPGDHMAYGRLGLADEDAAVDSLAAVLAHEQIAERGRAGEAADMGGQDPVLTSFHGAPRLAR